MTKTVVENPICAVLSDRSAGKLRGLYACCSANAFVIRAALRRAAQSDTFVLVESTANQVDQNGGYTGMTPQAFRAFLDALAEEEHFPKERLLCGGDHLGPLTWQHLPEAQAMENAEVLVRAYVAAGYIKIHLDTSMRLADDNPTARLSDAVIARRAVRLCAAAEDEFRQYSQANERAVPPVYVIGSEVPIPGGAQENEDTVAVTSPSDFEASYAAFETAFHDAGLCDAWSRIIAFVVQPGVEFADESVVEYNRAAAAPLAACLRRHPNLVFEGHSTDFQPKRCLKELVEDGVAILKVGPALTYTLREGLFALEQIELELHLLHEFSPSRFRVTLEEVMLEDKKYWQKYYSGSVIENRFSRAYSYSDRARYYFSDSRIENAIKKLLDNLDEIGIPMALLRQYMPIQYSRVCAGTLQREAQSLLTDHIGDCIDDYMYAVFAGETEWEEK